MTTLPPKVTSDDPPIVHILYLGRGVCGFEGGAVPGEWPPGHRWTRIESADHEATCGACRRTIGLLCAHQRAALGSAGREHGLRYRAKPDSTPDYRATGCDCDYCHAFTFALQPAAQVRCTACQKRQCDGTHVTCPSYLLDNQPAAPDVPPYARTVAALRELVAKLEPTDAPITLARAGVRYDEASRIFRAVLDAFEAEELAR